MKGLFLLLPACVCSFCSDAQLSISDTITDGQINIVNPTDGKLTGYYPNGNKQYDGYTRKEDLHGAWNSWYPDGQPLDAGFLQKGIPDGKWSGWYANGNPRFIRTYASDKWQQLQQEKTRYHPKRVSMPITQLWVENKKQATKYTNAVNTFCNPAACSRNRNETLAQRINDNVSTDHYHPLFENGLLHGTFVNYFPDGSVKDSGVYRNGLPEDLWIKWTDDKKFYWKGYYHHGMKNKEWKLYSSTGRLIRILFFKDGKYVWRKDMIEGVEETEEEMSGF